MDNNEKLVLSHLSDYCAYYSISDEALNDKETLSSILNNKKAMDELIQGYLEMGQLNSEICKDFKRSEDEALTHLRMM